MKAELQELENQIGDARLKAKHYESQLKRLSEEREGRARLYRKQGDAVLAERALSDEDGRLAKLSAAVEKAWDRVEDLQSQYKQLQNRKADSQASEDRARLAAIPRQAEQLVRACQQASQHLELFEKLAAMENELPVLVTAARKMENLRAELHHLAARGYVVPDLPDLPRLDVKDLESKYEKVFGHGILKPRPWQPSRD